MIIDPDHISGGALYQLLISTVVPRPIAWVSTVSPQGAVNLAPFSFFQAIGSRPPMVTLSIGHRVWDGGPVTKDTLRNIEATGELVINLATVAHLDAVNASSAEFPPDVSELEALGLAAVPSDRVKPPRLADSPVGLECVLDRVIRLGEPPQMGLVIARIVRFHIADDVWDEAAGRIDPQRLDPLARLGGPLYAGLGELHTRARPAPPPDQPSKT